MFGCSARAVNLTWTASRSEPGVALSARERTAPNSRIRLAIETYLSNNGMGTVVSGWLARLLARSLAG
uniref:Uncharacterized protein n=1 Tax=uncultured organism MedDCM-OCT-S08-C288 TaxID=743637 RepID=D6PJ81_9ZZZZ|nr:hypothetical protein [uncultured organism MedDCM-OCT-S08-C288]